MGKNSINLHGHSHGRLKPLPHQYDVGVDARRLRPMTLREILAIQLHHPWRHRPPRRDIGANIGCVSADQSRGLTSSITQLPFLFEHFAQRSLSPSPAKHMDFPNRRASA